MPPPRSGRLAGKVVFVTGAARGQGRTHCVRMAAEGADVVALDLCGPVERRGFIRPTDVADLAETARLVTEAGGRCVQARGDVRSADDLASAREEALAAFGRVDVVCANAGTLGAGRLQRGDVSEAVLGLASDEARGVTGAVLPVDMGMSVA